MDIWAVGCLAIEMATGYPLFRNDSQPQQSYRIFRLLGVPSPEILTKVGPQPKVLKAWKQANSCTSSLLSPSQFNTSRFRV
eukprot:scaffold136805_cov39-Prasinocladus_malaysianus.AAC.1